MKRLFLLLTFVGSLVAAEVFDKTKGVSSVCPVHRGQMRRHDARILVGSGAIAHELRIRVLAHSAKLDIEDERKKKFPFPERTVAQACEDPTSAKVIIYVCDRCSAAEATWIRQKEANKAPEPTPGAVTPRASESLSK